MKLNKTAYILLLPLLFLASCVADDLGLKTYYDYGACDEDGIEFSIEEAGLRTRSVSFNPGAMVKINSVWVGIFDLDEEAGNGDKSYKCVSNGAIEQNYIEINSNAEGKVYKNLIRVPLKAPDADAQDHRFIMVSVVNFNDVKDQDGYSLGDKLESVKSWDEFVNIAVDTKTGYSYPHDADSPIMAGFLRWKQDVNPIAKHIQVDQFNNEEIFPQSLLEDDVIEDGKTIEGEKDMVFTYDSASGKYNTDRRRVRLRRLVANINVNIEVINSDIEVTSVTYRRHNMPESVYIIERRTAIEENGKIKVPDTKAQAANYADKVFWDFVEKGRTGSSGYKDDEEWQIDTNRDNDGLWTFSFQHFANKKWARNSIEDQKETLKDKDSNALYSMREERKYMDSDPENTDAEIPYYFKALAKEGDGVHEGINDFNNMASYFEVKIHMIDRKTNRCADAVYVIHEGNTSTYEGDEAALGKGNLDDFTTARNINYIYNIKVGGFQNIFLNVADDKNTYPDYEHHPDQGGQVWKMIYMNDLEEKERHYYMDTDDGTFHFENVLKGSDNPGVKNDIYDTPITTKDENNVEQTHYYKRFENAMEFDPSPNLAFRLYGYTNYRTKYNRHDILDEPGISGYNYNFERSSFSNLFGLWPPSAGDYSHYFMDDISLDIQQIPADLRNGVIIKEHGTDYAMDMIEFVKHAEAQTTKKSYDVYIIDTDLQIAEGKKAEDYVRAIYIGDRNGIIDPVDKCSKQVNIYCIAQYPNFVGQNYDMIICRDNTSSIVPASGNSEPYLIENNLSGNFNVDFHEGKGMVFSSDPNLAFRMIGFDDNDNYVDVCYNFDINNSVYNNFKDQWPKASTNIKTDLTNLTTLMAGMKVHMKNGDVITVQQLMNRGNSLGGDYPDGFVVDKYNHVGEVSNGIRRLYVFDKNMIEGTNSGAYETGQKDYHHQIYGISQYPEDNSVKVEFKALTLGHKTLMEKRKDAYNAGNTKGVNYAIHYVDASYNWCGTVNSLVEMPMVLTDAEWIKEYKLEFYFDGETSPAYTETYDRVTLMQGKDALDRSVTPVLKTNWPGVKAGYYDVVVTAIPVDASILYSGNNPVTLSKQLHLSDMSWNFSNSPWVNIDTEDFDATFKNYAESGSAKNYTEERNFFFEYNGLTLGVYTVKDNTFGGKNGNDTFIGTFQDENPSKDGVLDGPTNGHPYQFKFTTLKSGTLTLKATSTDGNARNIQVQVGNGAEQMLSVPGNSGATYTTVQINADETNGTEVTIFVPITGNGYNGTIRIYGFELK